MERIIKELDNKDLRLLGRSASLACVNTYTSVKLMSEAMDNALAPIADVDMAEQMVAYIGDYIQQDICLTVKRMYQNTGQFHSDLVKGLVEQDYRRLNERLQEGGL